MATRFYLPTPVTPNISPACGPGWVQDPALERRDMQITFSYAQDHRALQIVLDVISLPIRSEDEP